MTDARAPRMVDLRLMPTAIAAWAASWWATAHPVPWPPIVACVLAATACAASYAWTHRHARPPRHALTPPRSLRLATTLLLTASACTLAVSSAAGRPPPADPPHPGAGPPPA